MTKEEARKTIDDILACFGDKTVGAYELSQLDAKDMREAIKALSAEPCDDAISRQAAIDAFERFIHELGIEDEPYNYGEMALSAKNVPSVTSEQKMCFDKIRAEIETQEKWLAQVGYNAYNVDIAFSSIKSVLAGSED